MLDQGIFVPDFLKFSILGCSRRTGFTGGGQTNIPDAGQGLGEVKQLFSTRATVQGGIFPYMETFPETSPLKPRISVSPVKFYIFFTFGANSFETSVFKYI